MLHLIPVIIDVTLWSYQHLYQHITEETRQLAEKIKEDKDGFTAALHTRLAKEQDLEQIPVK